MTMMWFLGLAALQAGTPTVPPAQVATAQPATQPMVTAPPAIVKSGALQADLIDYFKGRWDGSGAFVRGNRPLASTYHFEPIADGEALLVRHREAKPNEYAFDGVWSVDKPTGELVMMIASNGAGGARLFRSKGWEGERMVFQPDTSLRTDFALERMTFERLGATRFTVRYEMSRDGTTWGGGDFQTFVKQAGSADVAAPATVPRGG